MRWPIAFALLACDTDAPPRDITTPEVEVVADITSDADTRPDGETRSDVSDTSETFVPPPCETTAPTSCPSPAPTYADIAPIVESRCLGCHYGALGGPWPLTSYDHVADWRDTIRGAMLDCSMPPPEEQVPITTDERMQLLVWIRCGMPQ